MASAQNGPPAGRRGGLPDRPRAARNWRRSCRAIRQTTRWRLSSCLQVLRAGWREYPGGPYSALIAGFDQVVEDFKSARGDEGENLQEMIATRLEAILEQVAIVETHMPEIAKWQREKLAQKLEDLTANIDESRLEQELIYLAQKQDVAEELDRLKSHVKETKKILTKGGACGRRLDFMMQEFNREANTLASKSINSDITTAAVELKVLIEQMREQIQNIE